MACFTSMRPGHTTRIRPFAMSVVVLAYEGLGGEVA